MRQILIATSLAFGLSTLVMEAASAQAKVHSLAEQTDTASNPHTSPEDVIRGAKVFRSHCSTCHGRNAEGFRGPSLATGRFRHGQSDARLFKIILNGIPGTSMAGVYLADSQVWQVITYIRSLSGAWKETTVPGDPARGKVVFDRKGECATCHTISGEGGRRGNRLTEIGWMRSIQHIRQAILDPSAIIEADYRLVQLTIKDGEPLEGILLNEDTYSIQFMDEQENLVSVAKKDVREMYKPALSLMPEYDGAFTDEELTDLIAYLHSLQGDSKND